MYQERRSTIPGATLWRSAGSGPTKVLPDGCIDIVWTNGRLIVAGPDTYAHLTDASAHVIGLRFDPGVAAAVLGVPAHSLRDARIPLDSVWTGSDIDETADRLSQAAPRDSGAVLEDLVRRRAPSHDDRYAHEARGILSLVAGGARVAEIARETGWSQRQLHRKSLESFGYGLATLRRVLRLQAALGFVRSGLPLGEVAAQAGYSDQPHLTREFRALTGGLPTTIG